MLILAVRPTMVESPLYASHEALHSQSAGVACCDMGSGMHQDKTVFVSLRTRAPGLKASSDAAQLG